MHNILFSGNVNVQRIVKFERDEYIPSTPSAWRVSSDAEKSFNLYDDDDFDTYTRCYTGHCVFVILMIYP